MTPREKLDAISECRACLEHDPVLGREALPETWARFDRAAGDAVIELVREFAREYVQSTIPESRVWEET